jgi:hypothetical protein
MKASAICLRIIKDMYFTKTLKVGTGEYPQNYVRSRMHKLHGAVLCYALEKIKSRKKNIDKVTSNKAYIISCIFNAITEYCSDIEVEPYLNIITSY